MSHYAKIDDNQKQIVRALKRIGASVQSIASVGLGVPDLLVGLRGVNYLLEVKDGGKPKSHQELTVAEEDFHRNWRGQVNIVRNAEEAIRLII